jgi:CRISPR-associated protein Cmr2
MTLHLVAMSIGPVQDFIAAARRTSDLFAGSRLLSKVTGAAAAAFPPPPADPSTNVGRIFPLHPGAGGANRILAIVGNPQDCVTQAAQRARNALIEEWDTALRRARFSPEQRTLIQVNQARARAQIADFLEIYAAWVPWEGSTADYADSRRAVEHLLAGRKALRDFRAAPGDDQGYFNSPLDPARCSVVTTRHQYAVPEPLRKGPLFLNATETLDGVSLLKRLCRTDLLTSLPTDPGQPAPDHIPSTRELAERSWTLGDTDPALADDPAAGSRSDAEAAPHFPYFCVLVADGDHMGALLSDPSNNQASRHRQISDKLDAFAQSAAQIIQQYGGVPVYTGGDDVMALLPLLWRSNDPAEPVTALHCAQRLSEAFAAVGQPLRAAELSVGLAVCHYKEPLSHALRRARECEADAKQVRNALSFGLYHRSGEPLRVRQRWPQFSAPAGLANWVSHALRGHISRGMAHEVRNLVNSWPPGAPCAVLAAEVRRVYQHSAPQVPDSVKATIERDLPAFDGPDTHYHGLDGARQFANCLIAARFLGSLRDTQPTGHDND